MVSQLKLLQEEAAEADQVSVETLIVKHPDGYYWQAQDGRQEFGPFDSYEEAQADCDAVSEAALAPGEMLHEAEQDIGIADWIDPDTGEPAEGASRPHFSAD
jgi:hypothetical protein